jgi:hypothetical protein
MIYRLIFYFAASIIFYILSIKSSYEYKYDDYRDYLVLISGISGMVFTIMGIWIAFLYPNAMSKIVDPKKIQVADFSESRSDSKRLEKIVGAVMTSAIVMIIALMITLFKIIISITPIYIEYRFQFKSAALSAIIFMTFVQLESVINVVLSNIIFINDLHFRRQDRQANEEL